MLNKKTLAYITGIAIGDGNLSNPNGRATRLRITCDKKYINVIEEIIDSIKVLLPNNKTSLIKRNDNCLDISCYSNNWEKWLEWQAGNGSKIKQNVSIPSWIMNNKNYSIKCLKGLVQTDGSIYVDRGYKMINFVTAIPNLASDVEEIITKLGFKCHLYISKNKNTELKTKYTIRISKDVDNFIKLLDLYKN